MTTPASPGDGQPDQPQQNPYRQAQQPPQEPWQAAQPGQPGQPEGASAGLSGGPAGRLPAGLTGLLQPLYVGAAGAVLLVLTVISFLLTWGKGTMEAGGQKVTVSQNGFGRVSAEGEGETRVLFVLITLLILVLVAVGAVLVVVTGLRKLGALLIVAGGAFEVLYGLVGFISKVGAGGGFGQSGFDDLVELAGVDYTTSFGFGAVLAFLLGVLTVALGALYLLSVPGPVIPRNIAASFPGTQAQPGQPGQQGAPAQPGQQGGSGQPGFPGTQGQPGQQGPQGWGQQ